MSGTLTVSGNEITDAVRTTGTQGDGAAIPGGIGVWEATTNLCTNGGFESGTTGWSSSSGAGLASSSAQAKFGSKSMKVTPIAVGRQAEYAATVVAGTYSTQIRLWIPSAYTNSGSIQLRVGDDFVDGSTSITNADMTKRDQWQNVIVNGYVRPTNGTGKMVIVYDPSWISGVFYIDGVQVAQGSYATPYVETNGATATRNAARVQASKSLLSTTQSAVAFRIAYGFPSTATRTNPAYLFDWRDDANNLLGLWLDTANKWNAGRETSGAGSPAVSAAQTFAMNDTATVIFACDSGHVKVSVNGGAFTSVANTSIPTLAATLFDLGSQAAASQFDGRILWAATFAGTLADADAASIGGFGNTAPRYSDFPKSALVQAVVPMVTTSFISIGDWIVSSIAPSIAPEVGR